MFQSSRRLRNVIDSWFAYPDPTCLARFLTQVSQSTVKIMCDEQFHGDRPRVVRMASVVLATHPGLPKQKQRTPRASGSGGRAAKTVGCRRR